MSMSLLSQHDLTVNYEDGPFHKVKHARVVKENPVNTLKIGERVTVVNNATLHPHHMSHGWYIWVQDIKGAAWLLPADHLEPA